MYRMCSLNAVGVDLSHAKTQYSLSAREYGVATISRLLKIIGLFGKRAL